MNFILKFKFIFLFVPLLLLFVASSCEKHDFLGFSKKPPALPPVTTTGEHTFGCLVNGKVWLPNGEPFKPKLTVDWVDGQLVISAKSGINDEFSGMAFFSAKKAIYSPGVYRISSDTLDVYFYKSDDDCVYDYELYKPGVLEILRLDTLNRIVSGKFHYTATKPGCDTIRVTEGRFDLEI